MAVLPGDAVEEVKVEILDNVRGEFVETAAAGIVELARLFPGCKVRSSEPAVGPAYMQFVRRLTQREQNGRFWSHRTLVFEHSLHAFLRGMISLAGKLRVESRVGDISVS